MKGLIACSAVVLLALVSIPAQAQWVKVPRPDIPRMSDGKPNLSAPAPRTSDGKPDLSGIWNVDNKYVRDLAVDLNSKDVPYQPWARTLLDERENGSHSREDNAAHCLPPGTPRINAAPFPWKLIQKPDFILIIYEDFNLWRQIFLDGREVADDATPTWFGYSIGRWDGDTLVVDTKGFNGKAWLDQGGKPATESLHVTERFRRKDFGHMDIQVTIDDPKAYTKPWTMTEPAILSPETELMEFICGENNRDLEHLPGQ